VDEDDGRCDELPGHRVVSVPCAAWVHPLTIERALRHGASGILVAACAEGNCPHREGSTWTRLRLAGERKPVLRPEKVDASRVRLVQLPRGSAQALVAEARAFAGVATGEERRSLPRWAHAVAAGLVLAAATATVVAGSRASYAAPPRQTGDLVVSFVHPGRVEENCRDLAPEELAQLPVHMRKSRQCDRKRADVRLRVLVDGQQALLRSLAPKGVWSDGSSIALERIPLEPGRHEVQVAVGDSSHADEWSFTAERVVEAVAGRSVVVELDRERGFTWH
jgi:coenzyme F420-reducing hydrogenase delta subunit